ncbi:MAG: hypothetical protein R2883_04180 [Caldisericia bacterium]
MQQDGELSIFFGTIVRLGDFDYYLIPEYVNSEDYLGSEVNENLTAIRVEFESEVLDSKTSKNVLIAGHWNFESGCVDTIICRDESDHFDGEFKDGFFHSLGKKYFPIFASDSVIEGDFSRDSKVTLLAKLTFLALNLIR